MCAAPLAARGREGVRVLLRHGKQNSSESRRQTCHSVCHGARGVPLAAHRHKHIRTALRGKKQKRTKRCQMYSITNDMVCTACCLLPAAASASA